MKKNFLISGISIIVASLLIGCGSSSSPTDPVANNNEDTNEALTGQFIDSPVENLEYECNNSGISGLTDKNGTFKYMKDEKVKFKLGNLVLGEAHPQEGEPVTPRDLTDNNETLTLMLQLLQSLDSDNNVSNGITIPEDVIEALSQLEDPISITELNKTEVLELDDTLKDHLDKDKDGFIDINEQKAHNHFKSSIDDIKHGGGYANGENNGTRYGGGYGHNESNSTDMEQNNTGAVVDVFSYEKYELTQEVIDAIAYMGNEERLAYDVYKNLYETHLANGDEIKQLINIPDKSEVRHIQTVRDIVTKYEINATEITKLDNAPVGDPTTAIDEIRGQYDIQKVQDLYDALFDKGVTSVQDALEVGCMVEVTDVNDLNEYIKIAQEASIKDVEDAFTALRAGSYNHYWNFDKGLKNLGIEDGCCAIGVVDGVDYCQPDYPKTENGKDNSNREGNSTEHGPKGPGRGQGHNN